MISFLILSCSCFDTVLSDSELKISKLCPFNYITMGFYFFLYFIKIAFFYGLFRNVQEEQQDLTAYLILLAHMSNITLHTNKLCLTK